MDILPADYPPPFRPSDQVVLPSAAEDERIDVGVLIVGAGPAGLATAVRLGQLLGEDPELAEQLGEVPVAVADKGKTAGSHLLSGAVMRPGPLKALFPDTADDEFPTYGKVTGEAVYLMRKRAKIRIPTPPQMKNHGNWIISISQMARWMSEQAEELGAFMLPETDAQKLIVDQGRVLGVVTGDKGRGRDGEELSAFEPGAEVHAKVTVIAEGTPGHLAGVVRSVFDLDRDSTQSWELGVKEVWRVPKPLGKLIHTLGWPLSFRPKYREYGGSWIYPMGEDMISLGYVIGLDYADATLSAHDILQEFKTHPFIREILAGGERVAWGAKTIPGGGLYGLPSRLHVPGAVLVGDSAGFVDMMALKGVHLAIQSGTIAGEQIYAALKADKATTAAGLWGYTKAHPGLVGVEGAVEGPQHPPGLPEELRLRRHGPRHGDGVGRPPAAQARQVEDRRQGADLHRRPLGRLPQAGRRVHLRQALQRLRQRQRDPRRPAQPHPRAHRGARGPRHGLGQHVPGQGVRDRRGRPPQRHGDGPRQRLQLRAVRRDHGQGRAPHAPRGRQRPRVHHHLILAGGPRDDGTPPQRARPPRVDAVQPRAAARAAGA